MLNTNSNFEEDKKFNCSLFMPTKMILDFSEIEEFLVSQLTHSSFDTFHNVFSSKC